MKTIVNLCRYLLAITFVFSGFVKGIDPLGTAYKLHDYFMAFGMEWLNPASTAMAVLLCAAELFIGLLLLFGAGMRLGAMGALVFMAVFTPLTLYLAIANPVSDCGCFGDAVKLSNWQTFFKNVVLVLAAIVIFMNRHMLTPRHTALWGFAATIVLAGVSLLPPLHGLLRLPAIDFRPYSVGTNLRDAMRVPEGAPADVYRTTLFYEKDGRVQEFDESNYPWQDTTWTFVDSRSELVERGYTPPIGNFALVSPGGVDLTDSLLVHGGYMLLAVAKRLEDMSPRAAATLAALCAQAQQAGLPFVCATASPMEQMERMASQHGIGGFVQADETILKTMVRANPGLLMLHEGTIIGKWHWRAVPRLDLSGQTSIDAQCLQLQHQQRNGLLVGALLLLLLGALVATRPPCRF
ncbi:MAG: DoxX family membrane protein [Bacteroidales bacterium]|nr:DoxX family membrane protein [Bacteroidales bacterium]